MYTAFYGLREKPFALSPDPRFLFLAESHREALAHLLYGIDQGEGFIAVTGEVGTGKTTLCRSLLDRLGAETEVAFLFNPSRNPAELLQSVCLELGIEIEGVGRRELGDRLNRFLLEKKREHRRVLLIVDEAQNLSPNTLEQIRLLSNLETSSEKLIQILLLGQPELDEKLDSDALRQLRQRISVRWNLRPLGRDETGEYVRHRLRVAAGAARDIFDDAALKEIHRRTGGIPRLVNVLCDRLLLSGYSDQSGSIDRARVERIADEIPDTQRHRDRGASGRRGAGWRIAAGLAALVLGMGVAAWALGVLDAGSLGGRIEAMRAAFVAGRPAAPVVARGDAAVTPLAALEPTADAKPVAADAASAARDTAAVPPSERALAAPGEKGQEAQASTAGEITAPRAGAPATPGEGTVLPRVAMAGHAPAREVAPSELEKVTPENSASALDPLLVASDPVQVERRALDWMLASYELPPSAPRSEFAVDVEGELRARGLTVLELAEADLDTLRSLNHPALLSLTAAGEETRLLALLRLGPEGGMLYGVGEHAPLRLSREEIEARWDGSALVVWREFESMPPVISPGSPSESVLWLQGALSELGLYVGPLTGTFDEPTARGVRTLQLGRRLSPDGAVGPRTKMVLYDMLEGYSIPRLARAEGSG